MLLDKNKYKLAYYLVIYEIMMIVFSLSLVALSVMDLLLNFQQPYKQYLMIFDWLICFSFALELVINLFLSKNKLQYLKRSLITILMIIPFASMFKILAIFRLNRIFSLLSYTAPSGIGLFSTLWQFFMLPAVVRISKFINLARNYITKTDEDIK